MAPVQAAAAQSDRATRPADREAADPAQAESLGDHLARVGRSVEPETIVFASADGLEVTADLSLAYPAAEAPMAVLFHQAGSSRGEYREIARRLNELGLNCLAVDQRSGGASNGVRNETAAQAARERKATTFTAAEQDMIAALEFVRAEFEPTAVVAFGSSYSAALVLRITGERPGLIDATLSFSPGEYFGREGKPGDWIRASARKIETPVFISSARNEARGWQPILRAIDAPKTGFVPEVRGRHGASALWSSTAGSEALWHAVTAFFREHGLLPGDEASAAIGSE